MFYCIAYDISSNRLRLKVSKICLKIGLIRVQRSLFIGKTWPSLIADLEAEVRALLPASDRFLLVPLDQPTFQKMQLFGKTGDLARLLAVQPVIRHY